MLDGIRRKVGDAVKIEYAPGIRPAQRTFPSMFDMFGGNAPEDPESFDDEAELQRAADLARESDVAVVVVGEWQNMIGEAASRSSLELPGRQLELLQAVVETGTPVVLLVMNGRPLDLRWAAEHVPAILDIWYPGTRGGARSPTCCSVTSLRAASFRSPGRGRSDRCRWSTPTPARTSLRTRGGATGMRRGRRCSPSGTASATAASSYSNLTVDRDAIGAGRGAARCRWTSPIPETVRRTRWSSSTSTSDTGRRRGRSANSRVSSGSASGRGSLVRCSSPLGGGAELLERGSARLGAGRIDLRRLGRR